MKLPPTDVQYEKERGNMSSPSEIADMTTQYREYEICLQVNKEIESAIV
jgi:hypothetical protein